jgi:hypothetical protein
MDALDQHVGKAFGLIERWKLKGTGSPTMVLFESSADIYSLTTLNADTVRTSIELRSDGLIVYFRSRLDVYAWAVAYHHLSLYQNGLDISIHGEGSYIKARTPNGHKGLRKFFQKMMALKSEYCGTNPT